MALELGMVEAFCGVSRQAAPIYEVKRKKSMWRQRRIPIEKDCEILGKAPNGDRGQQLRSGAIR
jgi:hypothetical protein